MIGTVEEDRSNNDYKRKSQILNMNGKIIANFNGIENESENITHPYLFSPYGGLYVIFPFDGKGVLIDCYGNSLTEVDKSWIHVDNKYTMNEDYDLALIKYSVFNVNGRKSYIYYELNGEIAFKTDYVYYNSPFNLDGFAYGVKKRGAKKKYYFDTKGERVK